MAHVFVTGATGYLGRSLIPALLARGHRVRALTRRPAPDLPAGCEQVRGDALDGATYVDAIAPCDTLVHLVGVAHPGPAKAAQFISIDLASATIAATNAQRAGIAHFVYVSVAQPAPVMRAYVAARAAAEQAIREAGLHATILRPWYVLGPGHRWPYALLPLYRLLECIPATRAHAQRLGLVSLAEMTRALCHAVDAPPAAGMRVLDVAQIRASGSMPNRG